MRDEKGRFVKGVSGNPSGVNQTTVYNKLIDALEKKGSSRREGFWDMVAEKAYTNPQVLVAVLKKILPDKVKGEGFGDTTAIYSIIQEIRTAHENRMSSVGMD